MGTTITINVSALIFWYKNQHLAPWNEHSDSIADLWSTSENGFESSKHSCPICYPQQRHVTNHSICPSSTRPRCQHFINIIGGSSCCHQQQCSLHETKTVCFRTCPLRVNSSCDHSLWEDSPSLTRLHLLLLGILFLAFCLLFKSTIARPTITNTNCQRWTPKICSIHEKFRTLDKKMSCLWGLSPIDLREFHKPCKVDDWLPPTPTGSLSKRSHVMLSQDL